jgi:hypothetical protein
MSKFLQPLLRPVLFSIALAFVVAVPSFTATAANSPRADAARLVAFPRANSSHWANAGKTYHLRSHATCPTGHFLYADEGTSPNNVAEYTINADCSLTLIGKVPTGSSSVIAAFGSNYIATSKANGPCVFHSDTSGQVESFTVSTNGSLTLASSVTVADGVSYYAGDIRISADGKTLYEANIGTGFVGSQLNALSVGSGCKLTLTASATESSPLYFSIQAVAPGVIEAVDYYGHLDFYKVSGSTFSLIKSNNSSIVGPDGLSTVVVGSKAYSLAGQATFSPPQAELDTTTNGTLTPFPGSPATDGNPTASNGAYVIIDKVHKQGIQSAVFSDSLELYGLVSGNFAWISSTSLPVSGNDTTATTILGTEIYVNNVFSGGPIVACVLGAHSISGCSPAANLPDTGGVAEGVGVL